MSTIAAPFGLRPAYHPSGQFRAAQMTIASGYAANLLQGQPVLIAADGTIQAAAAGARFIGVFQGVEFTDGEGRRRVSNRWLSGTVATEIIAYVTRDPQIVYEVQASGSIAQSDVGSQLDVGSATAGSAVTGLSAATADIASITNSASAGMRILTVAPGPDNAAGDAFTIIQVQISEHQDVADRVAF
jgi:hypothetical protein